MDFDELKGKIVAKIPYDKLVSIKAEYRWGIVGGIPVLMLVIFAFLLIKPIMGETVVIEEELAKVQNEVQIKRSLARRLPDLEREIENKDYELTLLRRQLPEKKEIPNLLDQVSNLGTQAGLEFITFKPMKEVEKDFYAEVPVKLKMTGKFHDALTFFDRISRMPRIVTVTDLAISAITAPVSKKTGNMKGYRGKQVELTLKVITYRFLEERVDIPKEEKGKKNNNKKKKNK